MPNWPQRWGGPDRTLTQRAILAGELALDHAPEGASIGFERGDPVLIHHGSPAQQQHCLPKILSLEYSWCQGYSEPKAGSDIASLATRAVRDGDH